MQWGVFNLSNQFCILPSSCLLSGCMCTEQFHFTKQWWRQWCLWDDLPPHIFPVFHGERFSTGYICFLSCRAFSTWHPISPIHSPWAQCIEAGCIPGFPPLITGPVSLSLSLSLSLSEHFSRARFKLGTWRIIYSTIVEWCIYRSIRVWKSSFFKVQFLKAPPPVNMEVRTVYPKK